MHNNLFLNRLVIYTTTGEVAYDEKFHRGINIIRGENSSGKSTISHFIFYILGGAFNDWVKEAKECSVVYGEVILNGAIVTLKRELIFNKEGVANKFQAMEFYWDDFENAKKNIEGWQKFNFSKTDNKKSFSNVLFENLDIPIVKGENNISMHQLLRLMYIDQESPINSLFLYEFFDTTLTRETVSDLLLGVYSQELYDDQQTLEEYKKEQDDLKAELAVMKKFIHNKEDLVPAHITNRISVKEKDILELDEKIISYKEENKRVNFTKKSKLEFEELNQQSLQQRSIVKKLNNEIRSNELEIEDTKYFIRALENNLISIKNSITTRDFLGNFSLDKCPECLSPLDKPEIENTCGLCKKEIDNTVGISEARKIEQEIYFQVQESKKINSRKEKDLFEKQTRLEIEKAKLHQLQIRVNQSLSDVRSFRDEKIDKFYEDRGFLEGELIQLRNLLENAEIYNEKKNTYDNLSSKIDILISKISKLKSNQEILKKEINKKIEKIGVYLLNNDLKRQQDFFEAKEFHIDYRNNIAFISDKNAKYSASSSFYLRNSARYAIFLSSLSANSMRYPRFILCDNMEDKGIEWTRVHNFQKILLDYLKNFDKNTYQVIYTTSFILPELNNAKYCVGEFYTQNNPSLQNV
ncbi:AAA family ATPase [Elizabethkingia anophelis]|uniref:AAA family ATPase n=1 Tax=Elizabethkingia anophelis TaxID=1117645 RepID=UPI003558680C